jgi:acetyl esterase/lipase
MFVPPLQPAFAHLAEFDMGTGFGSADFDLAGMRDAIASFITPPPPVDGVRHEVIVLEGEAGVTADLFAPTGPGPHPVLVWFHGGGYVIGSPALDSHRMQAWTQRLGCVTVSVDYRLAPEHPYPAAHHDARRALDWVVDTADDLEIDPARIVVGGASAGGGVAAGLVLAARDQGTPLAGQLLVYPMIDDRQVTASNGWAAAVWSEASNAYGWRSYLGGASGTDVPAYAAAARAQELDGLPPTLLLVGGSDRFFDEDLSYATRLTHAGVPTEVHVYPAAPHGFDLVAPEAATSVAATADAERWLADVFAVRP